jgi:hypothetical protein
MKMEEKVAKLQQAARLGAARGNRGKGCSNVGV